MSLYIMPVAANPWEQQFTANLDGVVYTFHFAWNDRLNHWVMGILDEFANPICMGITLVTNYLLMGSHTAANLPPGDLFCWDQSGANLDPDDTTLGLSVLLLYSAVNS